MFDFKIEISHVPRRTFWVWFSYVDKNRWLNLRFAFRLFVYVPKNEWLNKPSYLEKGSALPFLYNFFDFDRYLAV